MWKLAKVTPIYKKDDKQLITNYRPISLLPIWGKILEKIIVTNLHNHLTEISFVYFIHAIIVYDSFVVNFWFAMAPD